MKARRTLSSYVLLVGVMGLSIAGGVLAYQIYSAAVKTQATNQQIEAIKPIDGSINQTTIDNLRRRTVLTDSQMQLVLEAVITPSLDTATSAGVVTTAPIIEPMETTTSAEIEKTNE